VAQFGQLFLEVAAYHGVHGYRFLFRVFRVNCKPAVFNGAPSIGFGFEHGDWSDELSSFRIATGRLSFPPAVHEYKSLLFRRPGFNPTVLIRVSSLLQHHPLLLRFEESCGATLSAFGV
jgi:hypothetical protein